MKKNGIVKISMIICLVLFCVMIPMNLLTVQADEIIATVQGTVLTGTTADILKISTKEGNMEIKMDSGTDTSACKILLPDEKVSVSVSHGSDGYLHAVKVISNSKNSIVTLDMSNTATVIGTVSKKTKDNVLYFNTNQGEMQIKLDTTTNMSGCSLLVANKSYSITCARGSDAYMHALSISDAGNVVNASNTASSTTSSTTSTTTTMVTNVNPAITPAASGTSNAATMSVTGTVAEGTKEKVLCLSTKEGVMEFAIDNSADTSQGMILTVGNKLSVSFYHGSDGYLHAVTIVGTKKNTETVEVDTNAIATVSGTVGSKSNEDILFLNTIQGEMELKLDVVKSVSGCKVLVSGKKLTVTCARGSDAYMHALDITAN